jgi:hypothetical protein
VNFDHGAHVFNAFEFAFKVGCDNSGLKMTQTKSQQS